MGDAEPTFDIEIEDADAEDFAAIIGGVSLVLVQAVQAGRAGRDTEARIQHVNGLLRRLLTENRELTRHTLLHSDVRDQLAGQFPDDLLDELGLDEHDGQFYDASDGDYEDIEVE